jgi:hypothetical protein
MTPTLKSTRKLYDRYPKNVLHVLAVTGRVNRFVKKYNTIAIYHVVYDAHPRWTRS